MPTPEQNRAYCRAYYIRNHEKELARAREYRAANHEACLERNREWKANNQQHIKDYNDARYRANKEEMQTKSREWQREHKEVGKAWRFANLEDFQEYQRNYRQINRDKVNAWRLNYIAKKEGADGEYTATDVAVIYEAQGGMCYYCNDPLGKNYHVDHKQPISRGGSNWPENLACTCQHCNLSKSAKTEAEFILLRSQQYA
jgi:5-methylcytosine-specific restriction endonuclease McrA